MISAATFERVGSRGVALATTRRVRIGARLLLAAAVAYVAFRLPSAWRDSHVDASRIDWWLVGASAALTTAGVGGSGLVWLSILRNLGVRTRPRWVAVYLQAQVAKYIPGTVWQYAGRAALARDHDIAVRSVALSIPVELGASAAAAAVVSLLMLGRWGALAVAFVFAIAVVLTVRRGRSHGIAASGTLRRAVRAVIAASPLYAAIWLVLGAGFWLTARAIVDVPVGDLLIYIGAFTAAWTVGLLALYAPGGLGVREAVIVAALHGRIGGADALVVAAASRVVFTVVDAWLAVLGALLLRQTPRSSADSTPLFASFPTTSVPQAPPTRPRGGADS